MQHTLLWGELPPTDIRVGFIGAEPGGVHDSIHVVHFRFENPPTHTGQVIKKFLNFV